LGGAPNEPTARSGADDAVMTESDRLLAAKSLARPGTVSAHSGYMGRTVSTFLGEILAVWVAFTAIGWILVMLKTFFVIGLIAVVVFNIGSLVAKRPRRG
jgi:predicted lipid-binding transport protein (Tim44 family)